ncbi:MAG TPA: SH3 domain-containing protein [Pyrinomonadaceae bacterium]|nr:SH3 domain-containing protein [Pyrinomonadaceae bacterium]
MKLPLYSYSLVLLLVCLISASAQKRATRARLPNVLTVADETLSVLRTAPSLLAEPVQRMRRGRKVRVLATTEADGVKFHKVVTSTGHAGWVQTDAVFGRAVNGDEERLARLVQAADGFDQIELASEFLKIYPASQFRAPILLLLGDILEESAIKLSRDAGSRLSRREMAATGAPLHSYYLNFNMLDRYRKIGIRFLFNPVTKRFHYDGASWKEIIPKHPATLEAAEARKRLDSLRSKLETGN